MTATVMPQNLVDSLNTEYIAPLVLYLCNYPSMKVPLSFNHTSFLHESKEMEKAEKLFAVQAALKECEEKALC